MTVSVWNHGEVRVCCDDGEHRVIRSCEITDEDTNDDGTISYPPSGECTCFDCTKCETEISGITNVQVTYKSREYAGDPLCPECHTEEIRKYA